MSDLSLRTIKIGNVTLREVDLDDLDGIFRVGSNPNVCKYLSWGPYKYKSEALWALKEVFFKRNEMGLPTGYSILVNGEFQGIIDYHYSDIVPGLIEIGYFLSEEYWGKGIMTKALKGLLDVGFNDLGYETIYVGAYTDNIRSLNLIERFKFNFHSNDQFIDSDNIRHDVKYYFMTKSEYLERK